MPGLCYNINMKFFIVGLTVLLAISGTRGRLLSSSAEFETDSEGHIFVQTIYDDGTPEDGSEVSGLSGEEIFTLIPHICPPITWFEHAWCGLWPNREKLGPPARHIPRLLAQSPSLEGPGSTLAYSRNRSVSPHPLFLPSYSPHTQQTAPWAPFPPRRSSTSSSPGQRTA